MATYDHILVPTDFSVFSEAAAGRAKDLAASLNARISLLHVVDYVPPGYVAVELPEGFGSEESLRERAHAQLEEWAARIGLADAKKLTRAGSAKLVIVDTATENDVDLIVMGTSGADILKRLIGSTTNAVLQHAPCDVLSVQVPS